MARSKNGPGAPGLPISVSFTACHGHPRTSYASQFTGQEYTAVVLAAGIAISMDGKGSWRDNVFVERLWRWSKERTTRWL